MSPSRRRSPALPLAQTLTTLTQRLSEGLAEGHAELLELVTPTTAELLHHWFGAEAVAARGNLNFHTGDRKSVV